MKKLLLCFILFIAYFAYRVHFWGDFKTHGLHSLINSLMDVVVSIGCGATLLYLNNRNQFFHRWILPISIGLMSICSFALFGMHYYVYQAFSMLDDGFKPMFLALCFQLLDSAAIVITGSLVVMLFVFSNDKKKMVEDLYQLSIARDKAELNYLRSKIEPHFIFNGLSCIYHEIDKANAAARSSLEQFSDIMRYHLQYASCEKVNFGIEMQYLQSYINFQYKRSSDFLNIKQDFQVHDPETEIEPLLILPFVENAFKFCRTEGKGKGEIQVKIEFNKSSLKLDLINTYDPMHRSRQLSNGFGQKNVIKRLNLLYPDRYTLMIKDRHELNQYSCKLEIAI